MQEQVAVQDAQGTPFVSLQNSARVDPSEHLDVAAAMALHTGISLGGLSNSAKATIFEHAGGSDGMVELIKQWAEAFLRMHGAEIDDFRPKLIAFTEDKLMHLRSAAFS